MGIRTIIFRGKTEQGEWLYGYLVKGNYDTGFGIIDDHVDKGLQYVKEETVGQFTGLTDKNGKKIFENDVVQAKQLDSNETVKVIIKIGKYTDFNSGDINIGVYALFNEGVTITINDMYERQDLFEVIGNIYDNKELLGE